METEKIRKRSPKPPLGVESRTLALLGVLLAAAFAAPLTTAEHSDPDCINDWTYHIPTPNHAVLYVVQEYIASQGWTLGVWIYAESNDRDGLQRHDSRCSGWPDEYADTLLFDGF